MTETTAQSSLLSHPSALLPSLSTSATSAPSSARRCLLFANPRAGALSAMEFFACLPARATSALRRVAPRCNPSLPTSFATLASMAAAAGLVADVEPVPTPEQLPQRLRTAQSEGYDVIIAAGGDGTVRTVAQGLVRQPLPLGILPMGTANNFARALSLPDDLEGALRVIATGRERHVDVGQIGNEYFLEGAGVGLFADALSAFGVEEPHRYQVGRLLKVVIPLCWNPPARRLRLTLDGVAQEQEAVLVTVANDRYLGENLSLAPEAALSDGLFDVIIVGALNRWELIRFAFALLRGNHLQLPKVRCVRARLVEISRSHRMHRPLPVHADDHIAGSTPVRLAVVPQALRVLVPSA